MISTSSISQIFIKNIKYIATGAALGLVVSLVFIFSSTKVNADAIVITNQTYCGIGGVGYMTAYCTGIGFDAGGNCGSGVGAAGCCDAGAGAASSAAADAAAASSAAADAAASADASSSSDSDSGDSD